LIDAVLAPIWVWLGFDEIPSRLAFIGAVIIVLSVSVNTGLGIRNHRRARAA
jgi:drug/metabolite transporter (DMT)-like permease